MAGAGGGDAVAWAAPRPAIAWYEGDKKAAASPIICVRGDGGFVPVEAEAPVTDSCGVCVARAGLVPGPEGMALVAGGGVVGVWGAGTLLGSAWA